MPPVGVVGWTWYEIINLCSHHVAGLRPEIDELVLKPRLPDRIDALASSHNVRGAVVHVGVRRGNGSPRASMGGIEVPFVDGTLRLPYPPRGSVLTLEFTL